MGRRPTRKPKASVLSGRVVRRSVRWEREASLAWSFGGQTRKPKAGKELGLDEVGRRIVRWEGEKRLGNPRRALSWARRARRGATWEAGCEARVQGVSPEASHRVQAIVVVMVAVGPTGKRSARRAGGRGRRQGGLCWDVGIVICEHRTASSCPPRL